MVVIDSKMYELIYFDISNHVHWYCQPHKYSRALWNNYLTCVTKINKPTSLLFSPLIESKHFYELKKYTVCLGCLQNIKVSSSS